MPRRKLIKGDRVKIIGPWSNRPNVNKDEGFKHIGKNATVINPDRSSEYPEMKLHMNVDILIDGHNTDCTFYWCRKNLRALPRKGKQ